MRYELLCYQANGNYTQNGSRKLFDEYQAAIDEGYRQIQISSSAARTFTVSRPRDNGQGFEVLPNGGKVYVGRLQDLKSINR